jgi:hypothetical protein
LPVAHSLDPSGNADVQLHSILRFFRQEIAL